MRNTGIFFLLCGLIVIAGCKGNEAAMMAARQDLRNSQTPFTQKAFIKKIADGDNNKVSLFLTGGMETEIGQHNSNALIVATQSNHVEIVEMLLNHGVDVDPKGFAGTPLCIASEKGYTNIAELLITKKANINYLAGTLNPIILAAAAGHNEIVALLLKNKADYDIQGESTKYSPLILAARNGRIEAMKLLLAKGADAQLLDYGNKTALTHAVFSGKIKAAELLIDDKSYDSEEDSTPALVMAIAMKRMPIAKKIIEKGTDLNATVGSMPILSWAIKNKHDAGAELLINAGADKNKTDVDNMIPIDYALSTKNEKIVKMLRSAKSETIK